MVFAVTGLPAATLRLVERPRGCVTQLSVQYSSTATAGGGSAINAVVCGSEDVTVCRLTLSGTMCTEEIGRRTVINTRFDLSGKNLVESQRSESIVNRYCRVP